MSGKSPRSEKFSQPGNVRLTQFVKHGGCAAKIGPDTLSRVLERLPKFSDPSLLVGFETSDDAAVYRVSEDTAVIQTLDFFPPVVDDPYTFGQVAAANALSDVYAMGGEPKIALNIVEFPGELDPDILGEILRGGADKVREAGAVLVGGHSIQDDVPKYGLAVTGFVHPDQIYKNYGCREGDVLILTKQLGSGIVNTAVKAQLASEESAREVIRVMTSLNKKAKETARKFTVHACTDVTGFGLLGHPDRCGRCGLHAWSERIRTDGTDPGRGVPEPEACGADVGCGESGNERPGCGEPGIRRQRCRRPG